MAPGRMGPTSPCRGQPRYLPDALIAGVVISLPSKTITETSFTIQTALPTLLTI